MADERDELPPSGPTGYYPDIRSAGPQQGMQDALLRIADALEGLLAETRVIRAHIGAPEPNQKEPRPEWPPRTTGG